MPSLEIMTTYPRFELRYMLTSPTITINGKLTEAPWGLSRFELAPGEYDVHVAAPSLFRARRGQTVIFVRLAEGDVMRLRYAAPRSSLTPATLEVEAPTVPVARALPRP